MTAPEISSGQLSSIVHIVNSTFVSPLFVTGKKVLAQGSTFPIHVNSSTNWNITKDNKSGLCLILNFNLSLAENIDGAFPGDVFYIDPLAKETITDPALQNHIDVLGHLYSIIHPGTNSTLGLSSDYIQAGLIGSLTRPILIPQGSGELTYPWYMDQIVVMG